MERVVCADVVVDPGAVVVEAHDAALAHGAVLRAMRLEALAVGAELAGRVEQELAGEGGVVEIAAEGGNVRRKRFRIGCCCCC